MAGSPDPASVERCTPDLSVPKGDNQFLRRTHLTALAAGVLNRTVYGYDAASRLATVADGTKTAAYSYRANSALAGEIGFEQGETTRMTTTRQFDALNRRKAISSAPSGTGNLPVGSTTATTPRTSAPRTGWGTARTGISYTGSSSGTIYSPVASAG